jgi:hypothetical protein
MRLCHILVLWFWLERDRSALTDWAECVDTLGVLLDPSETK